MKLSIELQTLKDCLEIIDNFAEGEPPESIKELKDLVKQASAKFRVVRRNETYNWNFNEGTSGTWTIHGVYLVDMNEITYCCEITPSYYLHHLYNTCESDNLIVKDEVENFSTPDDQNTYIFANIIDNLDRKDYHPCSEITEEDLEESYDKLVEAMKEHYIGNHYL